MRFRFGIPFCFLLPLAVFAQAHLVVTAEGHHGAAAPIVAKDDVQVQVNKHPAPVTDWVPLRGDQANLELFVVIDDGDDSELGLQYGELRNFMQAQPATTKIGLAYLQNGAARIAAPMTADREQVSKALRSPLAQPGISSSPYMGISDLIKKWPVANARREVLLIASGIDPWWSPPDPQDMYLEKAISDAQRAGIVVHSIYFPEAGHLGHSYWRANWGQNYLSELADGTGGELYWSQGLQNPVSVAPYLKDFTTRLENQYLLTVDVSSSKNELEPVRLQSAQPGLSLVGASKIDVTSRRSPSEP
jgi:hypothetical protein